MEEAEDLTPQAEDLTQKAESNAAFLETNSRLTETHAITDTEAQSASSNQPSDLPTGQADIPKSEIQTMEVHHHPDLHHDKKKFMEYFLEFLMIFIAVTMGFFAEQIREDFVESHREKQYMVSLVKDLESDMLQITGIIRFRVTKIARIDSLLIFFAANPSSTIPFTKYNLILQLFGHAAFFQNSGTLDQLNNSGGLRLIQKRIVVDSIESYNQQIKRMSLRDIYETDFMIENNKLAQRLIESKSAIKILVDSVFFKRKILPEQEVAINKQYLDEYLNSLITYRVFIQNNIGLQTTIKNKAITLLALIKNEYHPE